MKNYLKVSQITIISFIIFIILSGCANNIITTESAIIHPETITDMNNDENKIKIIELTDDIKRKFDAILNLYKDKDKEEEVLKDGGFVKDAMTAGEIAEVLFRAVFIDELQDYELPLEVYYDDENNYWMVRTSFPETDMRGGRRYIIINAVNAEVIAIWAFQ